MLSPTLTPRLYQEVIFSQSTQKNTLVVLPTGLGKTMIATMLIAHRLKLYPDTQAIFLAPTKPLVEQHARSLRKQLSLPDDEVVVFTGTIAPAKRQELFAKAKIICTTPQTLENDVMSKRCTLENTSLLIFDESHRAVGDYSYVYLAKIYDERAKHPRILALTASPGTDKESITQVCENLFIEHIEVRKESDKDVAPYVQEVDMHWIEVPFPEALRPIKIDLDNCYKLKLEQVQTFGYLETPISSVTKTILLRQQGALHGEIAKGNKSFELLKSISLLAEAMKVQHAIELVETQGLYALLQYLTQLQQQAVTSTAKATKNLIQDPLFKSAVVKANALHDVKTEHPKMQVLRELLLKRRHANPDFKVILFTQYRDQAVNIKKELDALRLTSEVFVGQAKKGGKGGTGLSQKEQQASILRFEKGEFSVLIATSVAEEGLDIPKVDLVLFYEPVPSAIRTVQRRGRTGRLEKGEVIMLVTKGTRDVGYRWTAHHKESRMYRAIDEVKRSLFLEPAEKKPTPQKSLQQYESQPPEGSTKEEKITIVADHREKGSATLKSLLAKNVDITLQQLSIGDYVLSDRCVVEFKTVHDFVDSIIDGRLLTQLRALTQYTRPLLIIEGAQDIFSQRNIHPNAIRGMIATITVSYGFGLVMTKNAQETAELLIAIAKREQAKNMDFQYHTAKPATQTQQLEYTLATLPGVGSTLAKPLLEKFGSIKGVCCATVESLQEIEKIGKKKAQDIHDFVNKVQEKE